jgi:AmmeMemoRadiSam system protein A
MSRLTDSDRRFLLVFARSVISSELGRGMRAVAPDPIPAAMAEKRGCFVTLHQKGALRGCIGTIEPSTPLIDAIADNAVNAAFHDPRFSPLRPEDLATVSLEVSLLTVPERLPFKDGPDLLDRLEPGVHGVILSKGRRRATFLPQVWEQLPDRQEFLAHLCLKAGMESTCWNDPDIKIEVYEAEYFSE